MGYQHVFVVLSPKYGVVWSMGNMTDPCNSIGHTPHRSLLLTYMIKFKH